MKTNAQSHESLSELRDFVIHQAKEDAVLSLDERLYQADLVSDVLKQEHLKPSTFQELDNYYLASVANNLVSSK